MATFLILTPENGPDRDHRTTRFIRDGFSATAFVLPGLWLLVHRLWLAGVIVLLIQVVGVALLRQPASMPAGLAILMAISLLTALEAKQFHAGSLAARGWQTNAIITADTLGTAEAIYFSEQVLPPQPFVPAAWTAGQTHGRNAAPALGLFDLDGGR